MPLKQTSNAHKDIQATKVISFHSIKGGTGKTSLAVITANELIKREKKVLLIDSDTANHSLSFYYSYGLNLSMEDISSKNIFKVFAGEALKDNIIRVNAFAGLVHADIRLADFRSIATIRRLKKAIELNAISYDYIIIDTAPTFDNITANILYASQVLVTPVVIDTFNFQSLKYMISKIKELELTELDINFVFNQYVKEKITLKMKSLFEQDQELNPFISPKMISKRTAIKQCINDRNYDITKYRGVESYQEIKDLLKWLKLI